MVFANIALAPAIDIACTALEEFILGAKSNVDHTFTMRLPKISKVLPNGFQVNIRFRKMKKTLSVKVGQLPEGTYDITSGSIRGICDIAVNSAIALI